MSLVLSNKGKGMQSSSEQPLVGEERYVTTRITAAKETTGREVRIGKNCARGLAYGPRPQAEGRTRDRGHSFSQYGPTKAGE